MRNIKTWAVLILSIIFLAGCNEKGDKNSTGNYEKQTAPIMEQDLPSTESGTKQTSYQPQNDQKIEVRDRLIIRNGTMNLEVDSYDEAEKKVGELIKALNGYILSTNSSSNASGKKQGTIAIKVPAEKYDELLNKVPEHGKVMSQNISATDVTEEYIDLEARTKTQKELEARLLQLLNEKTGNLSDVLEVEGKLADVRQKIESTEGRMNFLKKQASYSTLTLSVFEPSLLETSTGGGFFFEVGEAFRKGLSGFTEVLSVLITAGIALIPLWLVIIAGIFTLRWYLKRRKTKQAPAPTQ